MKKDAEAGVTVFLMADAVIGAKASQKTPEGYYSIERMLKRVLAGKGQVLLCSTSWMPAASRMPRSCRAQSAAAWTHSPPVWSMLTRCWFSDGL
jgi:hypothetical protein